MNDRSPKRTDKFRAYRARKKAQGLREIRLWVPDLTNPDIRAIIVRENELLRGHASEKDAAAVIDSAMADTMKDHD